MTARSVRRTLGGKLPSDLSQAAVLPMNGTMIALAAIAGLAAPLGAQEVIELPAEERYLEPDFEEVFRVGTTIGEPRENFAAIVKLAFDEGGNLYVFDGVLMAGLPAELAIPTSLRVVVFDAAGGFLHEFGRMGDGPGEFKWPNSYVVMRDGTTVVGNAGHRAYHIFDPAGRYVRMVRMPEDMQMNTNTQGDPRGGHLLTEASATSMRGWTTRPLRRLSLAGDVAQAETIAEGWLPESPVMDAARSMGFGPISMPAIFEPELLYGVLPDGSIVFSDSSTYRLKLTSPDSDGGARLARVITRPIGPQPVTPTMQKAWHARQAADQLRAERAGWRSLGRVDVSFYPELSVIQALTVTWNGGIWVQRQDGFPDSDGAIDVLTSPGEYIGTFAPGSITLPDAFGPDGLVAFIESNEMDVESVVVRRLPPIIR